jgi:hypothetical protein
VGRARPEGPGAPRARLDPHSAHSQRKRAIAREREQPRGCVARHRHGSFWPPSMGMGNGRAGSCGGACMGISSGRSDDALLSDVCCEVCDGDGTAGHVLRAGDGEAGQVLSSGDGTAGHVEMRNGDGTAGHMRMTGSDGGDGETQHMETLMQCIERCQAHVSEVCTIKNGRMAKGGWAELMSSNENMCGWLRQLQRYGRYPQLNKLAEIWDLSNTHPTGCCVYARVNLYTTDMYIGETADWRTRVITHYRATWAHSPYSTRPCRGCKEHGRYRKHRVCAPWNWIMIPIAFCQEKYEAKRLERSVIKRWKPSINAGDKPFWLMKNAYVSQIRSGRNARRKLGVRKPTDTHMQPREQRPQLPLYTMYEVLTDGPWLGMTTFDLGWMLSSFDGEQVRIRVQPGAMDLTDWRRISVRFADTYVHVRPPGQAAFHTTIKEWRPQRTRYVDFFELYLRPETSPEGDGDEVINDIESCARMLENADDETLAFFWRCRTELDNCEKYKLRAMVWEAHEAKFPGLSRKPIEVRLPFFHQLDGSTVKGQLTCLIRSMQWPVYIQDWHIKKARVITGSAPSIADILCNVTQPWRDHRGCKCAQVERQLAATGYDVRCLHRVDGHIFMVGREYEGPGASITSVNAGNVPRQTWGDVQRAWKKAHTGLAVTLCGTDEWMAMLKRCGRPTKEKKGDFPTAREAYAVRRMLDGLVIGPLDKNAGELWMCCPHIYDKALRKTYGRKQGYSPVQPVRRTLQQIRKTGTQACMDEACNGKHKGAAAGEEQDIVRIWGEIYRRNGWQRYGRFNSQGGFNKPYVLFKAKNVTDPTIRAAKLWKCRPISPGTKHPMRRILHLCGRAWSFVTARLPGEHFVINHGGQVPAFLQEAERCLAPHGELAFMVHDIESCYPNMPREAIRFGLRDTLARVTRAHGYTGVQVPRFSTTKPCSWRRGAKSTRSLWLPFELMLDVMEFALDNAIIKMPSGQLRRQTCGIPMGDPISPGMTIGTCAWMEDEWLQTLTAQDKDHFMSRRYMDDILTVYAKSPTWDFTRFCKDFTRSECYHPPLRLTDGTHGTFLETRFELRDGKFRYWLKNDNDGSTKRVWRYMHYRSHAPYLQKRALVTSCLKKVHSMASDTHALKSSAHAKIHEFLQLQYPKHMLRSACTYVAATTNTRAWLDVRDSV